MIILFEHERRYNVIKKQTTLTKEIVFETSNYEQIISEALNDSNCVCGDHLEDRLTENFLNDINRAITAIEECVQNLNAYKEKFQKESIQLQKGNMHVIEIYEPLLRAIDRHKYSYQIPEYTLNNFDFTEAYNRVINTITNKFNLRVFSNEGKIDQTMEQAENAVNLFEDNADSYKLELIKAMLGLPNSAAFGDFNQMVKEFFVNERNLQEKRIGDDAFEKLIKDSPVPNTINQIDKIIQVLHKELINLSTLKTFVENRSMTAYVLLTYVKIMTIRAKLIITSMFYLLKALDIQFEVFKDMCINYRKVIIHGYDILISDPENTHGVYNPHNDEEIIKKHAEYLSGHQISPYK